MKVLTGAIDRIGSTRVLIAGLFAAQICIIAAHPQWLLGEVMGLVRKGIMVDDSVCQSIGKGSEWDEVRSQHFRIYAERGVNLGAVERQLRKRLFMVTRKMPKDVGMEIKVAARIDIIYERARQILDMPPRKSNTAIRIFKTREKLHEEYARLTGRAGNIKAFHVYDCGVILTSEDDISDSVMAHEIAHMIIDGYYNGIPSTKISEMLASYVDMHIAD